MKCLSGSWRVCGLAVVAVLVLCMGPAWAQNITNVVETGGDGEETDTIVAQWTGQTFTNGVADEPISGTGADEPYTVGLFVDLAPAFVDRNHAYTNASDTVSIPSYLLDGEYIMSGNDNRDNADYKLDVTVANPSRAYMLIDNRLPDGENSTPPQLGENAMQWILDDGWTAVMTGTNRNSDMMLPDEVGIDEGADGSINQWYSIYSKDVPAGTFSLFQADNAGRNMYGAVVQVVPEPSSILLLGSAGLVLLSARRRRRR